MQRRPFIKLLGSSLSSLPFLPVLEDKVSTQTQWQQWLKQLLSACRIDPVNSLYYSGVLPPVPAVVQSGEFTKTSLLTYFYEQKQFCFQVFEKKHPSAGVLDLLIPFWARDAAGEWSKVTCLCLYDLKALAEAISEFSTDPTGYLLPLKKARPNQYLSAKGQVELISYLQFDGSVSSKLHVRKDAEVIGESGCFCS